MPWQREAADIALEVDPETGLLVYREVVLLTPRQSGKTTELLAIAVQRALTWPAQNIVYTAQTRIEARKKWEDEHQPLLESSPVLAPLFRTRKSRGQEAFMWRNDSRHGLIAATKKSGHGPPLDLGFIDEAFSQEDDRLEQAFRPAMIARPQPQLWITSTAGDAESTYLRSKVATGRARLRAERAGQTCYIEYSAAEDADPADPATWRTCMPALGVIRDDGSGISEATIQAELDSMRDEHGSEGMRLFRRAYLNQWPDEMPSDWLIVPEQIWTGRAGAVGRPSGPVAFGVSSAWPDAEYSSIVVAGVNGHEVWVELIDYRPGSTWLPTRVAELVGKWRPVATVLDDHDPAAREKIALARAKVRLTAINMIEAGQAYGMLLSALMGDAPYLRHYGQPQLATAVAGATKRPVGDAHVWARKGPADTSPVVAMSNALWGLLGARGQSGLGIVVSG